MLTNSLLNIVPVRDEYILVLIYDDGKISLDLGNGKSLEMIGDSDFSTHNAEDRHPGLRERWAMVLATKGDKAGDQGIKVGDKVLLTKLEWSRGLEAPDSGVRFARIGLEHVILVDDGGFTDNEVEKINERMKGVAW